MPNPLVRKLKVAGGLTDEDRATLESLCDRAKQVDAHQDLTREGDRPECVNLVLDGFAARYKIMPKGRRQIIALLVPGDFCDLHVAILGEMDHSITTLTPCKVAKIPRATIFNLTHHHLRISAPFGGRHWSMKACCVNGWPKYGQRDAEKRLAHLFCELLVRLQTVGLADENSYAFPLTQTELGDILGLTNVHVNRTLRSLREQGLAMLEHRRLTIPGVDRLKAHCGFRPNYLHLTPRSNGIA